MKQSKLFGQTSKESPKDEISTNADLLFRAGFIEKLMSGVYSYLPLGLRVLDKIKNIVRQEMNDLGAQEVLMPALQPKELWDKTGRWQKLKEIMFQFKGRGQADIGLAATHEEVITEIVSKRVKSYKDLPIGLYQMQDKFRNEARAKSGLLRGREFSMKDLYSFHASEDDFQEYYERSKNAYLNVFQRCGLNALITEAAGGDFTASGTHEFQVLCASGEDTIFYCEKCGYAQNQELAGLQEGQPCPKCQALIKSGKAIEVGNIFPLGETYSAPLNCKYTDQNGQQQNVIMGCYGIGPSRVMGTIAEVHHDDRGLIWPMAVAPYQIHLLHVGKEASIAPAADKLYANLNSEFEVLYDDRTDATAGEKFADSDLIGLPVRLVVSAKTLAADSVEIKLRHENQSRLIKLDELAMELTALISK